MKYLYNNYRRFPEPRDTVAEKTWDVRYNTRTNLECRRYIRTNQQGIEQYNGINLHANSPSPLYTSFRGPMNFKDDTPYYCYNQGKVKVFRTSFTADPADSDEWFTAQIGPCR